MMKKFVCMIILLMNSGCSFVDPNLEVVEGFQVTYGEGVFEYYEDVLYGDFFDEEDVEVEVGYFDTTQLGEYTIEFEYILRGKTYCLDVDYEVVDTVEPIIFSSGSYTIEKGDSFNYETKFMVADNYDGNVQRFIIGEYDVDKIGSYDLTLQCMDSSGNSVEKDFVLHVVEEIIESTTVYNPTKVYLEDVIDTYKNEDTMIGIDVSKWQYKIDWDEVKLAGVEFAMIRIGYQGSSTGLTAMDEYFWYNIENAKRVGIDVGVYFYTLSDSVEQAIEQAHEICEILDGELLDLPIVFDWEDWSLFNKYSLSIQDLNTMVDSFIACVESYGYQGMNYGSATYLSKMFYDDKLTWLAHYTDETWYEGSYSMWQLTSSGVVSGIDALVDINVLYK